MSKWQCPAGFINNQIDTVGNDFNPSSADDYKTMLVSAANPSGGTKHDSGKPRMELVSSIGLTEVAKVFTFGGAKYGDHNWRNGFKFTRLVGAIMRHTAKYLSGETHDPESGLSHMAHIAATAMFLLEFEVTKPELDDRYKTSSDTTIDNKCLSSTKQTNLKE